MQALDRTFHRQLGAGLGNVFHDAVAAPGAVDAHHMGGDAAFERHALALAPFCCRHGLVPNLDAAAPHTAV